MKGSGSLVIIALVMSLLLLFPAPFLSSFRAQHSSAANGKLGANNDRLSSYLQTSSLELGYGPGSLTPISQQLPVYTVNDQLWIESNYNTAIQTQLTASKGNILVNRTIEPSTAAELYLFTSSLATSNLTLGVSGIQSFSVPLQFVNPSNSTIGPLSARYSLNKGDLLGSLTSPNLSSLFDIQQCLTNVSSSGEAEVSLPSTFGTGFIGIDGSPSAPTAEISLQYANALNAFSFSYELLANFTYMLPGGSGGTGYTNSEVEVARSNSVLVLPGAHSSINLTLSDLASLRNGRYILRAFFENGQASQEVQTSLVLKSISASSWFWLGSCQELKQAGPPTISFEANLTGSTVEWPKFLYLMYQVVPGVESFTNVSLDLNLNRVNFVVNSNKMTLPSDIQVSSDPSNSNSGIESLEIGSGGVVYLITNGTYPAFATFAFSFGGKTFATDNVVFQSPDDDPTGNISLGELLVAATRGSQGIYNATVTIFSNSLNTSVTEQTNADGIVDLFVPAGSYNVTVKIGSETLTSTEDVLLGVTTQYAAVFPAPVNYTQDLLLALSIITVLGALGNFWFRFAKRRVRKFSR
ncbi:MAG: carboxypeptidase-like regulatory domain-containing protein [archaeon]|nr:carboxypeptidase-like regulatory domain-containing protein [archaeon]